MVSFVKLVLLNVVCDIKTIPLRCVVYEVDKPFCSLFRIRSILKLYFASLSSFDTKNCWCFNRLGGHKIQSRYLCKLVLIQKIFEDDTMQISSDQRLLLQDF